MDPSADRLRVSVLVALSEDLLLTEILAALLLAVVLMIYDSG